MKKLILLISLFLITLLTSAQIKLSESYAFTPDKKYHTIAGGVISAGIFLPINHKTQDPNLAFRASIIGTSFIALGKEMSDCSAGKPVSLADMSYTIGAGIIVGWTFKKISIWRTKKRNKKKTLLNI